MHGEYEIKLHDAGGFTDADFEAAKREGRLKDVLAGLTLQEKYDGCNQIFDNFAAHLFDIHMGGDGVTFPFNQNDNYATPFWAIQMDTDSGVPFYTELDWTRSNGSNPQNHVLGTYAVATTGIKRFVDDDIEATLIAADYDNEGKEEIRYRSRWLWLPNQGNSSNIKSFVVIFNSDGSQAATSGNYYADAAPIARIRIKDQNGNYTTLNKTSSQVLFLEYTFYMVSV